MDFQSTESELHTCTQHPFRAASPEGIVSCICCGQKVLEVKCPCNGREEPVRKLAASESLSISSVNEAVKLKKEHSCYYQVQMQMLVCEVRYIDFVL